MCMKADKEGACELNEKVSALSSRVDGIDARLTTVEKSVADLRNEARDGFAVINKSICELRSDFGSTTAKIVDEKVKWGEVLRKIVLWSVGTLLTLALAAAGINALPEIVKAFKGI